MVLKFTACLLFLLISKGGFAQSTNEHLSNLESKSTLNAVAQFAGGVGMISGGVSREFLRRKLETQILLGYVPKKYAGKSLWIVTAKQAYFPFRRQIPLKGKREIYILPFSFGVSVSIYNLPAQNNDKLPFYVNSMMYNYFLGGKVQMRLKEDSTRFVSFYYEVGSNYIETYTYYLNRSTIGIKDIVNIGLGFAVSL